MLMLVCLSRSLRDGGNRWNCLFRPSRLQQCSFRPRSLVTGMTSFSVTSQMWYFLSEHVHQTRTRLIRVRAHGRIFSSQCGRVRRLNFLAGSMPGVALLEQFPSFRIGKVTEWCAWNGNAGNRLWSWISQWVSLRSSDRNICYSTNILSEDCWIKFILFCADPWSMKYKRQNNTSTEYPINLEQFITSLLTEF